MSDTEGSTLSPSHESIVATINAAGSPSFLAEFGAHIKRTKIPKGQDEIVAAWQAKMNELGVNDDAGVVDSILAQKPQEELVST